MLYVLTGFSNFCAFSYVICITEEVEWFYDDVNTAVQEVTTNYTILMGDLNAKIGHKQDVSEFVVGLHGYGNRN